MRSIGRHGSDVGSVVVILLQWREGSSHTPHKSLENPLGLIFIFYFFLSLFLLSDHDEENKVKKHSRLFFFLLYF